MLGPLPSEGGAEVVWVEDGVGVVWVGGGAGGAETPAAAATSSHMDRTLANLARFYVFSTMPAPKEEEIRTK